MKGYIFLGIFIPMQIFGQQNLVVNPDFEQCTDLPSSTSQIYKCKGWFNPDKSARATPDYLRTDATGDAARLPRLSWNTQSQVEPRSGKAVASLFLCSIHEYLSTALTEPLQVGKQYRVTFYATVGKEIPYGKKAAKIGVHFSTDRPDQPESHQHIMNVVPHYQTPDFFFSQTWQPISFTFYADKPYRYMTIGSFDPTHSHKIMSVGKSEDAYVFFDDVEVVADEKQIEPETLIVETEPSFEQSASQVEVPTSLEGRTVQVQKEEIVFSKKLEIEVSDHKSIDGDIISLNFNGQWVLRQYTLQKKSYKIKLDIVPNQTNYLILYAHNLGKVPPNTAYLTVKAGKFQKSLTLSSGMGQCGAITFKYIE